MADELDDECSCVDTCGGFDLCWCNETCEVCNKARERLCARQHENDPARLRARLAEVEAERDLFRETHDLTSRQFVAEQKRAERAEARLAEVVALCDDARNYGPAVAIDQVYAAARGEGDRPAEHVPVCNDRCGNGAHFLGGNRTAAIRRCSCGDDECEFDCGRGEGGRG